MQFIYGGRTSKSMPPVPFRNTFFVSVNETYYSNREESPKVIRHLIIRYVNEQRKNLSLYFPAFLIMDVSKSQVTNIVQDLLQRNSIMLQKIPENLTYLFHPLDVQEKENGYVK